MAAGRLTGICPWLMQIVPSAYHESLKLENVLEIGIIYIALRTTRCQQTLTTSLSVHTPTNMRFGCWVSLTVNPKVSLWSRILFAVPRLPKLVMLNRCRGSPLSQILSEKNNQLFQSDICQTRTHRFSLADSFVDKMIDSGFSVWCTKLLKEIRGQND